MNTTRPAHHRLSPLTLSLFVALLLGASGCAKDPSKDAPVAKVGPASSASASASSATRKDQNVVTLTGTIGFVGSKVTGSQAGIFRKWRGRLKLGQRIEDAAMKLEVDVASVYNNPDNRKGWSEKLDAHLRNEDFFHAEKYPTATFVSQGIKAVKQEGATHTITGDLTLRGKTQSVTFPAKVTLTDSTFSAKAEFTIKRSEWGIVYKGKPDDLIRDGVVLKIDLKGDR